MSVSSGQPGGKSDQGGTRGGSPAGGGGGGNSGGSSSSGGKGGTGQGGTSGGGSSGSLTCGGSDFQFSSQLVDIADGDGVAGMTVSTYGTDGLAIAGSQGISNDAGFVTVCTPAGQEVYFSIEGQGYPPSITEDFVQTANVTGIHQPVLLVSDTDLSVLSEFAHGAIDTTKTVIAAGVDTYTETSPCKPQIAGWQFSISLADGGAIPTDGDGGSYTLVYLGPEGIPDPSLQATSATGAAVFFNVDPVAVGGVLHVTTVNTNSDAGIDCSALTTPSEFTGRLVVQAGGVSFAPVLMP